MKKLLKKIILIFFSFFFLISTNLTIFASSVKAQNSWYNQGPLDWYLKVYDEGASPSNEIYGERYTAAQVQWVIYSIMFAPLNMVYGLIGMSPTPTVCFANFATGTGDIDACLSIIPEFLNAVADKIKIPEVGINNTNASVVAKQDGNENIWKSIFLEDRPLSGIAYVRNLGKKLITIPEAKAADTTFGFSRLSPIQPLWKISRNIAYFFFIIITLIAAFMIMFKVKISPQAVVTIQSSIPKVVAALILVTFSYAIAGFMVDLVYVVMGIFSQFFTPIAGNYESVSATYKFLNGWLGDGFFSILLYSIIYIFLSLAASIVVALVSIASLSISSTIVGLILVIFFIINILILVVYIFIGLFNLFKALAGFYFAVIIGPIQLAFGALPSSHGTFGSWIKNMIGKLAVFPAQGILWYFGFLFLFGASNAIFKCTGISWGVDGAEKAIGAAADVLAKTGAPAPLIEQFVSWYPAGSCWAPPLLGNAGGATAIAFLLMSTTCILMLGKVHKAIESALAGKPFDYESAIGQPVKMTASTAGAGLEAWGKAQRTGSAGPIASAIGGAIQSISR